MLGSKCMFNKCCLKQCDKRRKKILEIPIDAVFFFFFWVLVDMDLTYKPSMWTQWEHSEPNSLSPVTLWTVLLFSLLLEGSPLAFCQSSKSFLASFPCCAFLLRPDSNSLILALATGWTSSLNIYLTNSSNFSGPLITHPQACVAWTLLLPRLLNNLNMLIY